MASSKFDIISGRAPGYWGGKNIRCRINSEFIADKVLSSNYDKIYGMGLPIAVWREASSLQDSLTVCSCFKDTSKQPDIPCQSCYGTGAIPGFFKFGTRNYWSASIDAGWTLSNIILDQTNRPFRFMLTNGSTSGTAISPNLSISVVGKLGSWESKSDGFTRDMGVNSTIVAEASKDNGSTWFALTDLETQGPTTQLRFRITMTRTAASVKSPMFEIVRARYATVFDIRNELLEPVIRILPTWLTEAEIRQTHGLKLEATNNKFWTLPLAFFDPGIDIQDSASKIADDVFIEQRSGGEVGYRYAITEFSYSETFSKFTRQEFSTRKYSGAPGEIVGEFAYRVF
jgi:hypothetical protein